MEVGPLLHEKGCNMGNKETTVAARVAALRRELKFSPSENSVWDAFIEDHGEQWILDHLGFLEDELQYVRELGLPDYVEDAIARNAPANSQK